MHVLWVKVGGLTPLNTGGRLRSFHLIEALSRRHRVTLLTTECTVGQHDELTAQLPQCARIVSFPHVIPKWRSARFAVALLRSWLSPMPVDIRRCRVPALKREVSRCLVEEGVDLCIADFLAAMPNVPASRPVATLLFEHNVEHMIWKRLAGIETRPWRRALLELEWHKLRRYETGACRRVNTTVAVSSADQTLLAALAPSALIQAVPTGVDTEYFVPDGTPEIPGEIVYVGSMDWQPNEDAVLNFMQEVLPRIQQAVPGAHFTVVGRNPSDTLRRKAQRCGVALTGTVDDVRPHLRQAGVCVVPLRIGGGTRLKIFEAMAMGKAVVSTSVGAEGLPLVDGRHYLRSDEPSAFANAVITLLGNPARRRELGRAGRELVERHYSWAQVAAQFDALCEQTCNAYRGARRCTPLGTAAREPVPERPAVLPQHLQQRR